MTYTTIKIREETHKHLKLLAALHSKSLLDLAEEMLNPPTPANEFKSNYCSNPAETLRESISRSDIVLTCARLNVNIQVTNHLLAIYDGYGRITPSIAEVLERILHIGTAVSWMRRELQYVQCLEENYRPDS